MKELALRSGMFPGLAYVFTYSGHIVKIVVLARNPYLVNQIQFYQNLT